MGASASLMEEKLNEDSLRQLCGDMYTPHVFLFLKDRDGLVDRAQFLQIAMDVVEQEVFHLYTLFCPDGQMDEVTCKVFLRNTKLLAKKDLPVAKAVEIFQSLLPEKATALAYPQVRFELFPKIADIKEISLENLLLRFSRSDEPVREDVKEEGQKIIDSVRLLPEFTPEEELARIKAALALQRASRPRQAQEEVKRLKELKAFEMEHADYSAQAVITHTGPTEEKCEEKFKVFVKNDDIRSQNPDLTLRDFVQLCYATNLIPADVVVVDFSAADARHVFNITTMKFFNKTTGSFAEGVSAGKRISYGVFRNLVLPEIAKKTNRTVEEVVDIIASDKVVIPRTVRAAGQQVVDKRHSAHFENLDTSKVPVADA
mmetsp:Transcript_26916/g.45433  ORF Transcript_26916/g.45433 Transcript_26916/m.45433 type:complete len:373 (+) Transcript_26916:101-1219(+)